MGWKYKESCYNNRHHLRKKRAWHKIFRFRYQRNSIGQKERHSWSKLEDNCDENTKQGMLIKAVRFNLSPLGTISSTALMGKEM